MYVLMVWLPVPATRSFSLKVILDITRSTYQEPKVILNTYDPSSMRADIAPICPVILGPFLTQWLLYSQHPLLKCPQA